jgi:hypothetical protein
MPHLAKAKVVKVMAEWRVTSQQDQAMTLRY